MRTFEEMLDILRRWPRNVMPDVRALAPECAEQMRELFDAAKVVIAFSDDEPWLVIAEADESGSRWREEEEADYSLVHESLGGISFLHTPGQSIRVAPDGAEKAIAEPIHPTIARQCGDAPILSIPILTEESQGRIFVCSPQAEMEAMLQIADVGGALTSIRFEATAHAALATREAVAEERIRVARDLHDGLLQSFTGVVLQLETIHRSLETHPDEARRMITETQAIIMSDQRELRRFVEQLRPRPGRREAAPFDFPAMLEDLRTRFAKQWGVRVALDVDDIEPLVAAFLGQETFRLIHEAVTNSAKHGGASDVHVGVTTSGGEMRIEVADNGSGFSFQGRMTLAEMRETGNGPTVLAERVHSLNGNLVVDSTDSGSTVTISIPLGWGGP